MNSLLAWLEDLREAERQERARFYLERFTNELMTEDAMKLEDALESTRQFMRDHAVASAPGVPIFTGGAKVDEPE